LDFGHYLDIDVWDWELKTATPRVARESRI